jgi:hypothetical protein
MDNPKMLKKTTQYVLDTTIHIHVHVHIQIIQKSSSSLNVSDTPLYVLATESMLAEITIGLIIPAGGTSPVAPSVVKNTSVLGAEDSGSFTWF